MLRIDRLPHLILSCLFWLGGLGISCGQSPVLERVFMPNAVADISAGMVYLPMEITYTAPDRLRQVDLVFTSATGDKFFSGSSIGFGDGVAVKVLRGTAREGTYQIMVGVPAHRAAGTWSIAAVLRDYVNAPAFYGAANVEFGIPAGSPPLPAGSTVSLTVVNPDTSDEVPPAISSLQVTPDPVDITMASQTVTVTATASDNEEVTSIYVGLSTPSGRALATAVMGPGERISGDVRSGTYRTSLTIPLLLSPGVYPLRIWVEDSADRSFSLGFTGSPSPGPAVQTTLTIVNSGLVDSTPPALLAISCDRTVVDVSRIHQTATLRWSAQDDAAGISSVWATLYGSDGKTVGVSASLYSDYYEPHETNLQERTQMVQLPITLPPGVYRWRISLTEGGPLGRTSYYGLPGDNVFPGGFTGELMVVNDFVLERNPPVITRIGIAPGSHAGDFGYALVEITAEINDDTGVTSAAAYLVSDSTLHSPDLNNRLPMTLVQGTPKAGVWRCRQMLKLLTGGYLIRLDVVDASRNRRICQELFPGSEFDSVSAVPIPLGSATRYTVTAGYPGYLPDSYTVWRRGHSGLAGVLGDLDADADGDGISNALEFICATDPLLPSQPGGPDPAASRALRGIPGGWELEPSSINGILGSWRPLVLSGWKSATLLPGSWEPVTPVMASGRQRYLLDPPAPGRPQQFLRLTVGPGGGEP